MELKKRMTAVLAVMALGCILHAEQTLSLGKQDWNSTIPGVTYADGVLRINVPPEAGGKPGVLGVHRQYCRRDLVGKELVLSVEIKVEDTAITPGSTPHISGPKFMVISNIQGKTQYFGPSIPARSSDFKKYSFVFKIAEDGYFSVSLGLQNATGKVSFRNLKIEVADTFADLSARANMGYADEKEKDGVGGWSDQGAENDGSGFDFRKQTFAGIPFRPLDPAKNNGKSVLVFRSSNFESGSNDVDLSLPAGCTGKYLYLLHTSCWNGGSGEFGTITLKGSAGTQVITLKSGTDIADQWHPAARSNLRVVQSWNNRAGAQNGMYASVFKVDPKIGVVQKITLKQSNPSAVWIVAGITLSDQFYANPVEERFVVTAGDRFQPIRVPESPRIIPGSALDLSAVNTGAIHPVSPGENGKLLSGGNPIRLYGVAPDVSEGDYYINHDEGKQKFVHPHGGQSRETITQVTEEAVRNGMNFFRLHCFDMVTVRDGVASLNHLRLDKWDWLIAECERLGVYFQIDTMHVNGFYNKPEDDWTARNVVAAKRNAKFHLLFSKEMRQEYKIGMTAFLHHVNPYTGRRLMDEPALAGINLCNEQEFAFMTENLSSWDAALPEWRAFIGDPNAPMFKKRDWAQKNETGRKVNEFITVKWREMRQWYASCMEEIGYHGICTLWDMTGSMHYNLLRSEETVQAKHAYHSHPTANSTVQSQGSDIESGLKCFRILTDSHIAGLPYLANETGHIYWNQYRYEQPFAIAAPGAFQGVDMIVPWCTPVHIYNSGILFPWCASSDPILRATVVQEAFLFARGDVSEAHQRGVRLTFSEKGIQESKSWNEGLNGIQSRLALLVPFGLERADRKKNADPWNDLRLPLIGGSAVVDNLEMHWGASTSVESFGNLSMTDYVKILRREKLLDSANRSNGTTIFENCTRELLVMPSERYMTINTPRFQGLCGETGSKADLRDLHVELTKTRGSFSAISLNKEQTLDNADHILLVYATNALGNGMIFADDTMNKVLNFGTTPPLLETGKVRFSLKNANAGRFVLYPLMVNGQRMTPVPVTVKDGRVEMELDTARLPEGPTVFFELAAKK